MEWNGNYDCCNKAADWIISTLHLTLLMPWIYHTVNGSGIWSLFRDEVEAERISNLQKHPTSHICSEILLDPSLELAYGKGQ